MNVDGSVLDIVGLIGLGALMAVICSLWTIGLAFRFQTVDIGSFMQTPVFILLFLAPVYVPIALLSGWLKGAASINPVTLIIDAGRGFISGDPTKVLYAYAASLAIAGLAVGLGGATAATRRSRRALSPHRSGSSTASPARISPGAGHLGVDAEQLASLA